MTFMLLGSRKFEETSGGEVNTYDGKGEGKKEGVVLMEEKIIGSEVLMHIKEVDVVILLHM